jgi:hypothetical protein
MKKQPGKTDPPPEQPTAAGTWQEIIKKALARKKPPGGWPNPKPPMPQMPQKPKKG